MTGGRSDRSVYDSAKYASLDGYAADVIELCRGLGVRRGVFVGHSVSAIIGILAQIRAPELFENLVLVGPSPRYIDDGDYHGGFTAAQIEELMELLDSNYMGWSQSMAPVIMGNPHRPQLGEEQGEGDCKSQTPTVTVLSWAEPKGAEPE